MVVKKRIGSYDKDDEYILPFANDGAEMKRKLALFTRFLTMDHLDSGDDSVAREARLQYYLPLRHAAIHKQQTYLSQLHQRAPSSLPLENARLLPYHSLHSA